MPSQYSTDFTSPVSSYEPLFSWCHHQQILGLSHLGDTPGSSLSLSCTCNQHYCVYVSPDLSPSCHPCCHAPLVSCLHQSRRFPSPPLGSDPRVRTDQTEAQKKHTIHNFSYDLGEQPLYFENNKSQHLQSTHYVSGAVLHNLHSSTLLMLITVLRVRHSYYNITNSIDVNLSKLWETVKDRKAWRVHGAAKSWTWLSDWITKNNFPIPIWHWDGDTEAWWHWITCIKSQGNKERHQDANQKRRAPEFMLLTTVLHCLCWAQSFIYCARVTNMEPQVSLGDSFFTA